jgi:hypothetical protein
VEYKREKKFNAMSPVLHEERTRSSSFDHAHTLVAKAAAVQASAAPVAISGIVTAAAHMMPW